MILSYFEAGRNFEYIPRNKADGVYIFLINGKAEVEELLSLNVVGC